MRQPWLNDARTVPARLVPPWTTCCPGSRGATPARSRPSATRPRAPATARSAGLAGGRARSEQVTEEVLLEVWRPASRFDPATGSGLSWIIAIAQRCAARAAGPAASLLTHPGLAALPAPQREAILLACCGYSWPEVADLARVPVRTVTRRLHDGLRQLSGP